jgi:glycosidase
MLDSVRIPSVTAGHAPTPAREPVRTLAPTAGSSPASGQNRPVADPSAPVAPNDAGNLKGPDWVKDAVFYQVFPERFRNGDTSNDPAGTKPWGTPPQNDQFFLGGDLNGVTEKLGHLQKLGVNALYLNPIFTSPSNHKYDTTDFSAVDPAFGGTKAFDELVDKAHAGGVKLVLDGVFNHTSNEHVWFNDVKEKGRESRFRDYYNVHRHPITTFRDEKGVLRSNDYEGWGKPEWGGPYATLPVLRNTHPEVMDALVTGKDSVMRTWLRDHKIDGWRMDVADEVEPEVWREARKVIKGENPNAYMLGENWQDASEMLQGDQFDGVMNYKYFQQPALEFFGQKKLSPDAFMNRLRSPYSTEAKLGMLNILESHDTPRFITQAGGDWYRARPAAIFQMTYQGAPSIYYGAEIGMEGAADPDSRRSFDWKLADGIRPVRQLDGGQGGRVSPQQKANELFGLYQKLIETRKGSEALRRGEFQPLATHNDDQTLSYRRVVPGNDAQDAIVALNNNVVSRAVTVPVGKFASDGTSYVDALSGSKFLVKDGKLSLGELDGNWGAVLLRER